MQFDLFELSGHLLKLIGQHHVPERLNYLMKSHQKGQNIDSNALPFKSNRFCQVLRYTTTA